MPVTAKIAVAGGAMTAIGLGAGGGGGGGISQGSFMFVPCRHGAEARWNGGAMRLCRVARGADARD